MHIIAGLGNPGKEYEGTRHNTGRIVLEYFRKKNDFSEWREDKKARALVSDGKVDGEKAMLICPEGFMNNSGKSLALVVKSKKAAEKLTVVYDDIDLAIGTLKISFDRGSGGHKGLESIIKALKTRAFARIRIGISPATPFGKLKKPHGEEAVIDFIMKKFGSKEQEVFKKVSKKAGEAILSIVVDGHERAMGEFN